MTLLPSPSFDLKPPWEDAIKINITGQLSFAGELAMPAKSRVSGVSLKLKAFWLLLCQVPLQVPPLHPLPSKVRSLYPATQAGERYVS